MVMDWRSILLEIDQGAEYGIAFTRKVDGEPQDFDGYTALCQIRDRPGGDLVFDLTPFVSVQPEGVLGRIEISVPDEVTPTIPRGGAWDLFMIPPDGDAVRVAAGTVYVHKRVSVSA